MPEKPLSILFVCSRNQWRSPTAEAIYRNVDGVEARSAGTASSARKGVSENDIVWADMIVVMEQHHLKRLRNEFRDVMQDKECHVLHIPDEFKYMDPELIEEINAAMDVLLP